MGVKIKPTKMVIKYFATVYNLEKYIEIGDTIKLSMFHRRFQEIPSKMFIFYFSIFKKTILILLYS